MSRFSVRLMGLKRTRKALKDAKKRGPFTAEEYTEVVGERVYQTAISLMQDQPKTGRVYQRPSGPHQASAPGEAPAVETGRLVASMSFKLSAINQYAFSVVIGSDLPYAAELEYYGPNYNGQPRPFLQPAVDIVEGEVGSLLADSWNRYKP